MEIKNKTGIMLTSPWSICPEKLVEIRNIYNAHLRGPKIDWKDMAARLGLTLPADKQPDPYEVKNGVAVIPVMGVLTKELSVFSLLFGGSSMKQIGIAFQAALQDKDITAIILDVDSPGGTVDGTEELAKAIYQARGKKPIVAYTDGMMASAAYWIASAADRIYISGDTVETGSIGVVATHVDQSKADDVYGEKYTEITAGKYKRIASRHAPLSDAGAAYIQDQVDYLYATFVNTVARNRGVNEKSALKMADGKLFIGKQAIAIGLVDGVRSFKDLIAAHSAGQQLSAPQTASAPRHSTERGEPETFEDVVRGYIKKRMSPDQAIRLTSQSYPELLQDYLARLRCGTARHDHLINSALGAAQTAAPPVTDTAPKVKLSLEDQAKKDFAEQKVIRDEFGTEGTYVAYQKAVAAGKAKIHGTGANAHSSASGMRMKGCLT